jgi:hypothetical protein
VARTARQPLLKSRSPAAASAVGSAACMLLLLLPIAILGSLLTPAVAQDVDSLFPGLTPTASSSSVPSAVPGWQGGSIPSDSQSPTTSTDIYTPTSLNSMLPVGTGSQLGTEPSTAAADAVAPDPAGSSPIVGILPVLPMGTISIPLAAGTDGQDTTSSSATGSDTTAVPSGASSSSSPIYSTSHDDTPQQQQPSTTLQWDLPEGHPCSLNPAVEPEPQYCEPGLVSGTAGIATLTR